MTRWLFTAFSFAVVIAMSVYAVRHNAPDGVTFFIPWQAHALAFLGFSIEVASRSLKLVWSAKAVGARLTLKTAVKTSLGGDFGASITPARSGAEPARYLILAESGMSIPDAMVVMYTELFFEMFSLVAVVGVILFVFDASAAARVTMTGIVGVYSAVICSMAVAAVMLTRGTLGDEPPSWTGRFMRGGRWAFVRRWVERIRGTVAAFKRMRFGWGAMSLLASFVHVGVRFTILPAIVLSMTSAAVPLGPLIVWPFTFIYGAGVVPAPAGGGAVEWAFHAALGGTIPAAAFAASLLWWRFYTFYLYIAGGAMVAGRMVLRAVREAHEVEEELGRA